MYTKKLNWIAFSFLFAISFSSCIFNDDDGPGFINCEEGKGDIITEELSVNEFKGIEFDIEGDVYLTYGAEQKVEVEGQANVIDLLELDIQNDVWNIEFDNCVRDYNDLKIYITTPYINYISVCGSGSVYAENTLEVEAIELKISGSGDLDLAIETERILSKISGSGKMTLEGNTDELDFKISGSGDLSAFDLMAQRCDIEIKGSGDAELYVVEDLDIKITGSGDVRYKGNPSVSADVRGSGKVVDAN